MLVMQRFRDRGSGWSYRQLCVLYRRWGSRTVFPSPSLAGILDIHWQASIEHSSLHNYLSLIALPPREFHTASALTSSRPLVSTETIQTHLLLIGHAAPQRHLSLSLRPLHQVLSHRHRRRRQLPQNRFYQNLPARHQHISNPAHQALLAGAHLPDWPWWRRQQTLHVRERHLQLRRGARTHAAELRGRARAHLPRGAWRSRKYAR